MKLGDKVKILEVHHENKRYSIYKIIQIINKGLYNMYLCKNLKLGYKTIFTDMDLNFTKYNKLKIVRRIYGNKSITTI